MGVRTKVWKGALVLPNKRLNVKEIMLLLRQIKVLMSQGDLTDILDRRATDYCVATLRSDGAFLVLIFAVPAGGSSRMSAV